MAKKQIPESMKSIIEFHTSAMTWVGVGGGLIGAGADVVVIAGSWGAMTIDLASQAGHSLDSQTATKVTMAVATGVGTFAFGMKAATAALGWVGALFTGGGSLAAAAATNAVINRKLTRRYGQAAAIYFLETDRIGTAKAMAKVIYQIFRAKSGFTYAINH